MGIKSQTTHTVTCDYCYRELASGSNLNEVIGEAFERARRRFDIRYDAKHVWECLECRGKRVVKEQLIAGKAS